MMSIFCDGVWARIRSILRWMRNAERRMSRTLKVPRLNETTTNPSSTSRRSSMYIEPRVPRKPWISSTGGDSDGTSPNASRLRSRLPRTRWRRYDKPSAPPVMSWPMPLLRPSHRLGASSAQRNNHELRFGLSSPIPSVTIVREALRDEPRALLRVRVTRGGGGRILDHPPLPPRAEGTGSGDHVRAEAIDQ